MKIVDIMSRESELYGLKRIDTYPFADWYIWGLFYLIIQLLKERNCF